MKHLIVLAIAGVFVASSASAATLMWSTTLTGSQERPDPVSTPATGSGMVEFDDVENTLTLNLSWNNLTSTSTMAHIHCCVDPSGAAGVILDLWMPADPKPTTGTYSAMYDLDDAGNGPFREAFVLANGGTALSAFQALATEMSAMRAYYNIHTETNPPGEIRGNLAAVPEPASVVLLLSGAALLFGARRFARS